MKNILLLIFSFLSISCAIFAQEKINSKETFIDAEYFYLYGKFEKALPLYLKLHDLYPDNANVNYRIGMSYLHITRGDNLSDIKKMSIPYLNQASENINVKYNEGSYKEKRAPAEVLFYLGNAYRYKHDFDSAIKVYEKFLGYIDVKDIYYFDYVKREIRACKNAKDMVQFPIALEIENLGAEINSPSMIENCPVVSFDETMLVFTAGESNNFSPDLDLGVTNFDYQMDNIYFALKEDGKWGDPTDISRNLSPDRRTVPVSLNSDGTKLYVVKDDNDDGNVYVTTFKKEKWSSLKKLNSNINTSDWESHASISTDSKVLYFTSDRSGGFGGLDIYKSELGENGDWGPAVNLGPTVNTPYDEETPYIIENGKTLYFSSQGHYGMGGFDIFHSSLLDNGEWTTPLNIGYPINTVGNDLFYLPRSNGEYAFFPLNANERGIGNNDIYKVKMSKPLSNRPEITVKGIISLQDKRKELPEDLQVFLIDSISKDTVKTITANLLTGEYSTEISSGNFKIVYQAKDYKKHTEYLVIPNIYTRTDVVVNVELIPLQVSSGEYVVIKSIFYDFNRSDLRRESKIELEKLYKLMEQNPSLYIEIIGHTDSKGSTAYNLKLSKKRARTAIDYLVAKGIELKRFVAKGAGESSHVAININPDGSDNPEGRQLNRRVDMKLHNSNANQVIIEAVTVPEYLKFKEKDITYSIQVAESKEKLEKDYFDKYNSKMIFKDVEVRSTQNRGYIYTIGKYTNKSEAIALLNELIDLGIENVKIVNDISYTKKAQGGKKAGVTSVKNKVYTIQIKALKKQVKSGYFRDLSNVQEYIGKDGFYRYSVGEFNSVEKAKTEWKKIIEKGYKDAFIINIKHYKKY